MSAKIITYGSGITAGSTAIPDETSVALDIESTDGQDFITANTTAGSESITLGQQTFVKIADTNVTANAAADDFVVEGTDKTGVSILTPNNVTGYLAFKSENASGSDKDVLFVTGEYNSSNYNVGKIRLLSGSSANDYLALETNGADRLTILATGNVGIKESNPDNHWPSARDLVVKGTNNCGITLRASGSSYSSTIATADADGTSAEGVGGMLQYVHSADYWRFYSKWAGTGDYGWRMNEYGVQRQHFSLAENSTALGDETSSNRAAYLADSGATLIINMALGCAGTVTLTANVTAVKFLYATSYGSAQNFTLKIKQHASAAKTVSYSSVTQYVGADGSTTKGTSMLWAGGADHVMSTGTSDIDIVNFTCIPNSDADRVVYASVVGQNFS